MSKPSHSISGRSRWPIRVPADWHVARRSGSFLYDAVVPIALGALALVTLGLILLVVGILLGVVPYR